MCVGGGSAPKIQGSAYTKVYTPKATITKPTDSEYKNLLAELDNTLSFIESQHYGKNNPYNIAQATLDVATRAFQIKLQGIESLGKAMADNRLLLKREATRLMVLAGPPPPEESASAPILGHEADDGGTWRQTGRHALTIDRDAGVGLQIL